MCYQLIINTTVCTIFAGPARASLLYMRKGAWLTEVTELVDLMRTV